jgi:uncharacterized protein YceH (UPF0502 family)
LKVRVDTSVKRPQPETAYFGGLAADLQAKVWKLQKRVAELEKRAAELEKLEKRIAELEKKLNEKPRPAAGDPR